MGGFSYADVLDSAKGWAATIKFNPKVTLLVSRIFRGSVVRRWGWPHEHAARETTGQRRGFSRVPAGCHFETN